MNLKEISLEELVDSCIYTCGLVKEDVFGEQHKAEILRRDKEKDLSNNEILFDKFSQSFVVNKWTPESGFDNPLDYYIHEIWKRDPVVVEKDERIRELEAKLKSISEYVVVMRSDLSSVLGDDRGWIMYKDKETALIASRSFCGVVKTKHEAELIIKDNIIKKLTLRAEQAEVKVKDMQCCGNCKRYNYNGTFGCEFDANNLPQDVCEEWKSDNLKAEERK